MKPQTKIYIGLAAAAIFAAGILGGHVWTEHKIHRLEAVAAKARQHADEIEQTAATREREAAIYKEKIGYLEQKLAEVRQQSRKQDEQLEKLYTNSRDARARVARTRGQRTDNDNEDDLCQRLAAAGHRCGEP